MITGWTVLTCILTVAVVLPIHLGLWLPLADRRLSWEPGPRRMSLRAARLVFYATVGLHLVWTFLSSIATTSAAGKLVGMIAANVLLAPFFFTASYGTWLHWRILRQPDRQVSS